MPKQRITLGAQDRKTIGAISRAQGQRFEQQIEVACDYYRRIGAADIQKTPEPMKPVKPLGQGKFVAVYTTKAQADFKGTIKGGRSILFEAKTTSTGRMEQSRVTPEQQEQLEREWRMGADTYVLCHFCGKGSYRIPWSAWRRMKELFGRKHITPGDVADFRIPEKNGILDFLGAFDARPMKRKAILDFDTELEELWDGLEDVPMNPETECIEQDYKVFPAGTSKAAIWQYFDKRHSKGVHYLLYERGMDHG